MPRDADQLSRTFSKLNVFPPPGPDGDEFTAARAIPCTYPGCGFTSRHRLGVKIHRTLLGHSTPADKLARGDGPAATPRVHRGPRRPSVQEMAATMDAVAGRLRDSLTADGGPDPDPDAVGAAVDAIVAAVAQLLDALGGDDDDTGDPTDGTSPAPATTLG